MTIVNIRGTNGSGKSTIAHRMIAGLGGVPLLNNGFLPDKRDDLIIGYQCNGDIRIVGRYNVKCGGADTFHTRELGGVKVKGVDDVERLIELWASEGQQVVFEGLIVSNIYGRWLAMSRRLGGMLWAFLDTPLDLCWQRVLERNGGKALKPSNHVDRVYNTNYKLYDRMQKEGEQICWIDHTRAYEQVLEILRNPSVVPTGKPSSKTSVASSAAPSSLDASPNSAQLLQVF